MHAQDLAGKDAIDVDGGFAAVVGNDGRGFRRQIDECLDGAAGFGLAARLEVFAHGDERQDRARALKIQIVHACHHGLVHLPRGQLVGHDEHGIERPGNGSGGAHGDEGIHGGCAVRERFKPVGKVCVVDVDDGDEQDELGEGERHAVDMVGENAGQRPAEHVSHAYVEQWDEEDDRDDEAGAHGRGGGLQLFGGRLHMGGARPGLCAAV